MARISGLSSNSWWRDPSLIFHNKFYQPDPEMSQFMRENSETIALVFGSYRSKATKTLMTYVNKFYRYCQLQDEPFEIIYIPMEEDESECEFFVEACMEEWLVVPWAMQNLRRNIRNLYNVFVMPWMIIVRNDVEGTVISTDGKADLWECGYFSMMEWEKMYLNVLQLQSEGKTTPTAVPIPKKESKPDSAESDY